MLDIPIKGDLSFEINPKDKLDDYDWMLFNYTPNLESQLKLGTAKLLRSNNSRNDIKKGGLTGVNEQMTILFEAPGPGKSYSKSVQVTKGQRLAFLIDNIYDKGSGFEFSSKLKPEILSKRILSGYCRNTDTKLPLKAKITCEDDSTGLEISSSLADSEGHYSLQIPVGRPVNVVATFSGCIFQTAEIEADKKDVIQDFNLNPISDTDKLVLYNIKFTPDRDEVKSNSEPELDRLIELLKKEDYWDVRIVGHSNNNPFADGKYLQKLSFNRAIAVKKYLIKNGISEKRLSCAGMGGKRPLVMTKNIEEGMKNLRVEVVLSRIK
jgi:outer membrane protein OmpA-like peptidoglycan-associated protein